jgi:hypothetical protein
MPDEPQFPFEPGPDDVTMPHDIDENDTGIRAVEKIPVEQFKFDGRGLTAEEFTAHVRGFNFPATRPAHVVLHHTASPSTRETFQPNTWVWFDDPNASVDTIKAKRAQQLVNMREFYRWHKNPRTGEMESWDRGPHLYIDDRWIWLFTPMNTFGIHAIDGNVLRDGTRTHYSIGIEVIGHYTRHTWPRPVADLVGHAVAVLRDQLGTFDLQHQTLRVLGSSQRGGISSHRDYNKPSCPGDKITNAFYFDVLREGWERFTGRSTTPTLTLDSPILSPESGSRAQVIAFIERMLPADSEYRNDVATIVDFYWRFAPPVGVDPFLAATQCVFETDSLRSTRAARPTTNPGGRRNPAGLGLRQGVDLTFASWEEAVQAHIGQLLAFALRDEDANESQLALMQKNPNHANLAAELRGAATTVAGLTGRWAASNDPRYAEKLLARAQAVLQG